MLRFAALTSGDMRRVGPASLGPSLPARSADADDLPAQVPQDEGVGVAAQSEVVYEDVA